MGAEPFFPRQLASGPAGVLGLIVFNCYRSRLLRENHISLDETARVDSTESTENIA